MFDLFFFFSEVDFTHPEIRSRVFRILKQYIKVIFVDHSEVKIDEQNSSQFQNELNKEKEEELKRYQQQQTQSEENDNNHINNEESHEHITDAQIVSN